MDEIRLWTVPALKEFCRKKNLKVTRRKDELVGTVFAILNNPSLARLATTAAEGEAEKAREYSDLLKTPTGTIPDPRNLQNWESEENGVKKWPSTMSFEIQNYLTNIDNVDLKTRLLQDYKDQKAFSYFASGWLGEVEYHSITEESEYCALRADCTPSQRIRDIPWKVWVLIEKKSGKIHSAFCTCFAGFSSSCNHVAALLFKVDYAWKNGLNNPACTSKPCEWSVFGGRRATSTFQPQRISDLVLCKHQHSKQGSSQNEGINPKARQLFSPLGARSTSNPTSAKTLTQELYPYFKDAAVFECIDMDAPTGHQREEDIYADFNVDHEEEVVVASVPLPLDTLCMNMNATSSEEFIESLPTYSVKEVHDLEEATRGQACNDEWRRQRKGRVTGSVAHAVMTKQRARQSTTKHLDTTSLVKRIMGYSILDESLPALKYGREMEEEARKAYFKANRVEHRHLDVKDCGLFVMPDKIYLGASPEQ